MFLSTPMGMLTQVSDIKDELKDRFSERFKEDYDRRHILGGGVLCFE